MGDHCIDARSQVVHDKLDPCAKSIYACMSRQIEELKARVCQIVFAPTDKDIGFFRFFKFCVQVFDH